MIFWCRIYSRFSIFLPKRLMFPQIICSTQLDTLCLQQSRKKRTRYDCLFFEENITRRVRRRFHEANIVGVPSKRAQHYCATLRRSQNKKFDRFQTVRNKCQHCCGSMQTDATSHNIVGSNNVGCCWQQCCVRLHGALELKCRVPRTECSAESLKCRVCKIPSL